MLAQPAPSVTTAARPAAALHLPTLFFTQDSFWYLGSEGRRSSGFLRSRIPVSGRAYTNIVNARWHRPAIHARPALANFLRMSEPSSSSPAGGQAAAKSSAGTGGMLLATVGWLAFLCGVAVFALVAFVRHEHEIEADRRYALAGEQRSVARAAATLAKNLAGGSIPAASPTSLASTASTASTPLPPPPPTPAFPRCAPARWSSSPALPLNRTPVSRPNGRCRPSGLASPRGSTPFRANGRGSSISGQSSRRFGGRAKLSGRARSGSPTPFPAAAGGARRGGGPDPRRATLRRSGRPGQPRGTGPPRPRAGAAGRPSAGAGSACGGDCPDAPLHGLASGTRSHPACPARGPRRTVRCRRGAIGR